MYVWHRLITAVALAALVSEPLDAQLRSKWSAQGSGLFGGYGGDETFRGIDEGWGFEAQARWRITPLWSVGCGFQGTYHDFVGFEGQARFEGFFCEPRRVIDVGSTKVYPYVGARAAYMYRNYNDSTGFDASSNGFIGNLGVGIMVPIGRRTGNYPMVFELGASAGYAGFAKIARVLPNGVTFARSPATGYNGLLRAGISIGFGSEP
jgi:hypothetical protein